MSERDRIEAMAQDGTLTREEADRLLAVLDDLDGVEDAMGEVDEAARTARTDPAAAATRPDPRPGPSPQPNPNPSPDPDPKAGPQARSGERRLAPDGVRWLRVEMLAGDLEVRVDPNRKSVGATSKGAGETKLEDTPDGMRLRQFGRRDGPSIVDRLVSGLQRTETTVDLPPGWGVDLDMKAGDVTLRGVPWLRGDLIAGDLDADALEGIDLTMKAGDVDVGLRPITGTHRIALAAGDVDVRLQKGSSVRVDGRVSIGDAKADAPLTCQRKGMGDRLSGTVGEGAAELELRLTTGDLKVRVEGGDG